MRSEENPLDLNNLPEDYSKDGKQVIEDTSSYAGGFRKKKSGGKESKDECGKVYECRFCSLKFCKSQALGGHMNRHRQVEPEFLGKSLIKMDSVFSKEKHIIERETETLNRARQLVFTNDIPLLPQPPHLGCQAIPHIGGDPTQQAFRSIYPTTRFFGGASSSILPPPPATGQPPYNMYSSPTRLVPFPPTNDYYVGHVLPVGTTTGNNPPLPPQEISNNYTCIGAPVLGYSNYHHHEEGGGGGGELSTWGGAIRNCTLGGGQRLDP